EPDPNVSLQLLAYLERIDISSIDLTRMPLNTGEAANARQDAAELIGLPPCHIESTDAARRIAGDGAAVTILANVVLSVNFQKDFIAQETRVLVRNCVVLDAPHRALLNKSRRNEDVKHHRNLPFVREIIEDDLGARGAIALNQALTVTPDHQSRRFSRIVLSRHVDPVVALHPLVEVARMHKLLREPPVRNARLLVGIR